ncbi:3-oxoadipate enol-lactonase [Janthinobacterium sp. 17J80-10]|uniref:3-oxoadipate enol-lactonase n=1 Tax=Janthinobacterium sp. 17J80-10 TaxID=2497863 RepID=UPI0010058219|nr:3-oxoadipate enol-lactonase [Janthinobacterium sp. 17J80-10]QAU32986.1 3-oxoadipate enol-lactonase [Janthinobacterium sp. 17J80-10]
MPQAKLADVSIHYQLDGDEKSPVLVMSNSLGTTLDMWAPQVEALSARFRLLRYDTRGHGQSQVTPGPYSIPQLGGDVLGLLNHLGIEKAHYCGLSMGGITGMWLAISHPQRIDRLVLANTAAYIGPPENWTTRVAKVQQDGIASIASAVVSRWLTPDYAEQHPEQVAYLEDMLKATPAEGYAANCIAVRDADYREAVRKITAPTLVIAGAGDLPTPPSDGRYLAESIPGAKYVELAGAHLSNQQEPQRFSSSVLEFLQA